MSRPSIILTLFVAALSSACNSPTKPTPPPPLPALAISCPAPVSAQSLDGNPLTVSFDKPTVTGGEAPLTTGCTPGAGSNFAVGSTTVTCTARDARDQTASCSFPVSITKVPRLSATSFVAFGDSITEGVTANCVRVMPGMTFAETMLVLPKAANDPWAYPNVLLSRLRERYIAQSPTVVNRGYGGEELSVARTRLPGVLNADRPQALLLQEGANDVNQNHSPAAIGGYLRAMVRDAHARGITVFLGTLLPQRPIGVQGSCRGYGEENVPAANAEIRLVAASEGAQLVDLYQAFGGAPGSLIGPDGLHPSEAGYQKIAETFFDAIKLRFEN